MLCITVISRSPNPGAAGPTPIRHFQCVLIALSMSQRYSSGREREAKIGKEGLNCKNSQFFSLAVIRPAVVLEIEKSVRRHVDLYRVRHLSITLLDNDDALVNS